MLIVPALLILGTPAWLFRWFLSPGSRRFKAVRAAAHFVPALVLFNVVFVCAHAATMGIALKQGIDLLDHTALVITGFVVWLPVLSPIPEILRLRPIVRCLYLFGWSVLPTIPASFLTLGTVTPVLRPIGHTPTMWGISALQDQQIAGLIMKLGMGLLLWAVIAVVFFRWAADEQHPEPIRPAPADRGRRERSIRPAAEPELRR